MPELPEVETIRKDLKRMIIGKNDISRRYHSAKIRQK